MPSSAALPIDRNVSQVAEPLLVQRFLGERSANHEAETRSRSARIASGLSALAVAAALALAALMLVPAALGFHRYVITGDSMSGTYDRGSLVVDEEVPVSDLEVGDVITYDPPATAGVEGPITHRIVSIRTNRHGQPRFRTEGDANPSSDPWTFTLDQPTQARVAFDVPYVGFVFSALSLRLVRILLIGLPALLIAGGMVARVWREAGEELRRREQAAALAVPAQPAAAPAPAVTAAAVPAADPIQAGWARARSAAAAPMPSVAYVAPPPLDPALRGDLERMRQASSGLMENLVRLRGRLEGVRPA